MKNVSRENADALDNGAVIEEPRSVSEKCVVCGRFIAYAEMEDGGASFYFEPDNHFGPERSEWTCKRCTAEGR